MVNHLEHNWGFKFIYKGETAMKETNNEETVKKRTNKNVLIGCLGLIMVIIVVLVINTFANYPRFSSGCV